jgi:hypothetical protein
VDFIIHSVNEVLQSEFGQTLGSKGVHIIDPFTGTGTFITRLLQSGLIAPEEMEHKYRHEIHANEIVLLAYYIAAINIEAVYHGLQGGDYVPFEGICLTDTFQMYESDDLISHLHARQLGAALPAEGDGYPRDRGATRPIRWGRTARTITQQTCPTDGWMDASVKPTRPVRQRDKQERALRQLHSRDPLGSFLRLGLAENSSRRKGGLA